MCCVSKVDRRAEQFHGLHDERQVVQEGVDGHSEDLRFVCAPPPETQPQTVREEAAGRPAAEHRHKRSDRSHRQRAARHAQPLADATSPRLPVRGQGPQGHGGLTRRWEGDVQDAAGRSRKTGRVVYVATW